MAQVFYDLTTKAIKSVRYGSGAVPAPPEGQGILITEGHADPGTHAVNEDGTGLVDIPPPAIPSPPARATRAQVEIWLHRNGFTDGLQNAAIQSYVSSQPAEVQIRLRSGAVWSADDPIIQSAAAALQIADLDAALAEASAL